MSSIFLNSTNGANTFPMMFNIIGFSRLSKIVSSTTNFTDGTLVTLSSKMNITLLDTVTKVQFVKLNQSIQ